MKIILFSIFLNLLLISFFSVQPIYGQEFGSHTITINIQRVKKSETKGKSFIEIELITSNPDGFYIGGLYWCLQIGDLKGKGEGGVARYTKAGKPFILITGNNNSRRFGFTKEEWKKLKNNDPMRLTWGCPSSLKVEKIEPFAFLNKKLLKNK